jgi:hypothetical protein
MPLPPEADPRYLLSAPAFTMCNLSHHSDSPPDDDDVMSHGLLTAAYHRSQSEAVMKQERAFACLEFQRTRSNENSMSASPLPRHALAHMVT